MTFAKKSLGQHFLHAESVVNTILDVGEVAGDDIVLEIGPGKGVLTKELLEYALKVIAVEKDDELYNELKEKFNKEVGDGKLNLIHGDILEYDSAIIKSGYKLIANIPYNITGLILRKFLSANHKPQKMVLLVQKEVAERIVVRGGKESILSLSVKAYGEPKYIKTVKAGSFNPPPNVDSAILAIENVKNDAFSDTNEENRFFKILRAGFHSKRKKLSGNLAEIYPKNKILEVFESLKLDPNLRAEDTDLEIWKKLSQSF